MARVGFFHHVGTFFLLVAVALLVVTDISAPVVHNISLLKVDLGNRTAEHGTSMRFGTFGYCLTDAADGNDYCSKSHIGYRPMEILAAVEGTDFSDASEKTSYGLTKVMILHPISTGIVFIAFLLSLGAGVVGSFLSSMAALASLIVTIVVVICDFVLFSIVKKHVHDDGNGAKSDYSVAMWTMLAAAICTLIGTIIIFFTCCSARMHRQHVVHSKHDGYAAPPPPRRSLFGRRRY